MKLYYYKQTIPPKDNPALKYYDHGKGIAGFETQQPITPFIGHMTQEELDEHLKDNRYGVKFNHIQRRGW